MRASYRIDRPENATATIKLTAPVSFWKTVLHQLREAEDRRFEVNQLQGAIASAVAAAEESFEVDTEPPF